MRKPPGVEARRQFVDRVLAIARLSEYIGKVPESLEGRYQLGVAAEDAGRLGDAAIVLEFKGGAEVSSVDVDAGGLQLHLPKTR